MTAVLSSFSSLLQAMQSLGGSDAAHPTAIVSAAAVRQTFTTLNGLFATTGADSIMPILATLAPNLERYFHTNIANTIHHAVEDLNRISDDLARVNARDVSVQLDRIVKNFGLENSGGFQVNYGRVNLDFTVHVTIQAEQLETVLLTRQGSKFVSRAR